MHLLDEVIDAARLQGRYGGPYHLVEEVGGGMSAVYRAERTGDYEQTVAVNLLRRRVYSCEVARRLRAERQVLAGLDPPDIASLRDGGVTNEQAGGRLYLVVEHMEGTPITE